MQHKYIFKYKKLVSLKIQKINHLKHVVSAEIQKTNTGVGGKLQNYTWMHRLDERWRCKVRVRAPAIGEAEEPLS